MIVGLVGVQLARPAARATAAARAHRRDGVECGGQLRAVVGIRPCQDDTERCAAGIDDEVALRARLAAVCRVRAGRRPPFLAGMLALSSAARPQSSCPALSSRSSRARCRAIHTPAICQSRSRRQHDMPEPQPISCGRYSHGRPVRRTNRMPASAARSGIGGRPPFGRGRAGGSSGAITAHRSSGTRVLAIPHQRAKPGFVRHSKLRSAPRVPVATLNSQLESTSASPPISNPRYLSRHHSGQLIATDEMDGFTARMVGSDEPKTFSPDTLASDFSEAFASGLKRMERLHPPAI